jgi:O-antigen/teichoic acid export membrane protein
MKRAAVGTYGSYLGVALLGLVNVLLIARALGPVGRGEVTFLMTVAGITGYVFNLSVHESNANFSGLKAGRIPALATNSVLFAVALGAVAAAAAVAALAFVPFLSEDVSSTDLAIALVSIPAVMVQTYFVYLARGSYRFTVANVALLTAPAVSASGNVALVATDTMSVTAALTVWSAGNVASAVLLMVRHAVSDGFGAPDRELAGESVTFGAKSHVGGILATGSYRMDQWIVGAVAGSRELGLYAVAVAWFEGLFLLPMAIASVARPDLVRAGPEEAGRVTAGLFRSTLIVTGLFAAILAVAAPLLCTGVFGDDFSGAVEPLRLLAAGALGVSAAKLIGIALIAQRRPLLESASMGLGFVVAITLYLVLIPEYGANGAAVASTIAYTAAGLAAAVFLVREMRVRPAELIPRPADFASLVDVGLRGLRSLRRA